MKIGLQYRSRLEASGEAGDAALQEFQSLLGALSAWANAQHNDDGGHTDVTAESVELTAIRKAALRVVSGWMDVGAGVAFSGAITPTQLTGDVNDYCPTGIGEAFMLRLTSNVAAAVGGLRDGDRKIPLGGRVLGLFNAGAEVITLTHEEVASSENFRFRLPGFADLALAPNTIALIYYDARSRRWAVLSSTGGDDGITASEYNAGDSGPNIEIDWANGTQQIVNLTHDANFTFVNGIEGQEYRLILTEGGAGDFVPDFGAGVIFENDNLKPTAIVAGQVLQVELYYTLLNGGQYFGTYTFPEVEVVDVFIGDSGSGGVEGLVPAPAAGDAAAGKFLHADGSWSVPSGGSGASIAVGAYASLPGTCAVGDMYIFTDSVYNFAACEATNVWSFFLDGKKVTPPGPKSGWTALNTGANYTDTDVAGTIYMQIANGGLNVRGLSKAQPSTPYKIEAYAKSAMVFDNVAITGLYFYDGTKLMGIAHVPRGVIRVEKWDSVTSFNSAPAQDTNIEGPGSTENGWFRITNDGATLGFDWSIDGLTWHSVGTEAVGTFITPTHYVIAGLDNTGEDLRISWQVVNVK